MKKISLVLASVLISSLVFAKEKSKSSSGPSVAVTNSVGSSLFKLRYASEKIQKHVVVTLFDAKGNSLYSETFNKTDGFIRPYNFKDLPEGHYAIQVEDESGKALEKIDFNSSETKAVKIAKNVHAFKVSGETNKYALLISSSQKDNVTINIIDKYNNVVYSEEAEVVNGGFGKVYTINGTNEFSIEVSDSSGLVKSANF